MNLRPLMVTWTLLLGWSVSGCFAPFPVQREANGRVLDGFTNRPVTDVTVTVENFWLMTPGLQPHSLHSVYRTVTDSEGRFQVEGVREWMFFFPFPDAYPALGSTYRFEKDGYEPAHYPISDRGDEKPDWIDRTLWVWPVASLPD